MMRKITFTYGILILLLLLGCSAPPSDESIKTEIIEYAKKCNWRIKVPNKNIYEIYSGPKIQIESITIVAKSFESSNGSVKFTLKGRKIGKYDVKAWYGYSYESAKPYLSEIFSYEGEWKLKKYDTGWKISQEPTTHRGIQVK